jgi:hypothetical protein
MAVLTAPNVSTQELFYYRIIQYMPKGCGGYITCSRRFPMISSPLGWSLIFRPIFGSLLFAMSLGWKGFMKPELVCPM